MNSDNRVTVVSNTTRVVIKVGTRLLTDVPGAGRQLRIFQLIGQIHELRQRGYEVILVSSGAIGMGLSLLGMKKRPRHLAQLQALASVGQSRLMSHYESACQVYGFHCAQILLSADDVTDRSRHLHVRNCLNSLLSLGVLPIINENDAVAVEEIRVGDNDMLAVLVACLAQADLSLLLTTVEGVCSVVDGKMGACISEISQVDDTLRSMARGTDGNVFSVGGMASKLAAAEVAMASGEPLWIADGRDFGILQKIFACENVGTLFLPAAQRLSGAKKWLAFFSNPNGVIRVDAGAATALRKQGKSLLPSGIVGVEGQFTKGDTVEILGPDGTRIGLGTTNYGTAELSRIQGMRTDRIAELLGEMLYEEAVHRNNMVVL